MCPWDFVCVPQDVYVGVLLALAVCIIALVTTLDPPIGDEEQKARKRQLTPERKRRNDNAEGNDPEPKQKNDRPGPPTAAA